MWLLREKLSDFGVKQILYRVDTAFYHMAEFVFAIGQFAVRNLLYGPKFLTKMLISEVWISLPRENV